MADPKELETKGKLIMQFYQRQEDAQAMIKSLAPVETDKIFCIVSIFEELANLSQLINKLNAEGK